MTPSRLIAEIGVPCSRAFEDDWPDGNPFAAGVHSFAAIGAIDDPDRMGPWFVLGGSFEGSDLLPGAGGYAVDMDTLI
jgi:hypothetical protein